MFNIIYSEFIKLKKSFVLFIALFSGLLGPGMIFMGGINGDFNELTPVQVEYFFKNYIFNIENLSFSFLYVIIFSLVAGYIFSREFINKTANILYTYPINRIKILFGKLITIYIIVLFVYIIQFSASYLALYILFGIFPNADYIINDIKVNIYSALLQFILIPIPVLIANVTKNIIFPIIYGVLVSIIGLGSIMIFMEGSIYGQFCPLMLPQLPFYYYHMGNPIDYIAAGGSAVITFGIFMFLCIYHSSSMDIN